MADLAPLSHDDRKAVEDSKAQRLALLAESQERVMFFAGRIATRRRQGDTRRMVIVLLHVDDPRGGELACLADELAEAQHWRRVHETAWRRELGARTSLEYQLAHQNGGSFVAFDLPAAEARAVSARRLTTTRLEGVGATRYTLEPDAEVSCPRP